MEKKILFIGGTNKGLPPTGGVFAKNQIILKILEKKYRKRIAHIDISRYSSYILIFLLVLNFIKYQRIVISTPTPGLKKIAFLNFLLKKKKLTIFITGGSIYKEFQCKRLVVLLQNACVVYGQTESFVSKIAEIKPKIKIEYLPNFKYQPHRNFDIRIIEKDVKLLYMSRVSRDKGIFRCFEILDTLEKQGMEISYSLDIFGSLDLSPEDLKVFNSYLKKHKNVNYHGLLDLRREKGYEILNKYHFKLFLTNHVGEGFPGVILDAMIAQVPIIASDWNYNKEIMMTEDGVLGEIIDLKEDYVTLATNYICKMEKDMSFYTEIQHSLRRQSRFYDANKIEFKVC